MQHKSDSSSSKIFGKKAGARDGHSVAVLDNVMYIFGGDRHQLSYNDFFGLDLEATSNLLH